MHINMEIEIKKTQETINDVPSDPKYSVFIKRQYGTGDVKWKKDDLLHDFDEADIKELAQKLSDRFLAKDPS